MKANYPKTPPLITIKHHDYLRESTQFKIQKFVDTQPPIFAQDEQEMIYKIVEGIREILEDAAQAKAKGKNLPSLEEERERHEAEMAKISQQQKEKEEQQKAAESKEEERVMAAMLQNELERQRQTAKDSKAGRRPNGSAPSQPSKTVNSDTDTLEFDQYCSVTDKTGNIVSFREVAGKQDPRKGQVSVVYCVRPVLSDGQGSHTMALKDAMLRPKSRDLKEFKKQLQTVEAKLQELKTNIGVQHRHIVEILDFKVESGMPTELGSSTSWRVSILTPLAEKGPLEELLELAGHLDIAKVRSWTRDLLDALNFLHNKNISHQDIHPGNILLFRETTGEIIPKLSDVAYQRELHNICTQKRSLPGLNIAKSAYWLPPEIAGASCPQYTFKTDIWDFGVVFVQMIFGLDVLRKYSSPKNLMESLALSHSLQELVSRFFKENKNKRPRAFELGASEFLATDAPVLFEDTSAFMSSTTSLNSMQMTTSRLRRESMNRATISSRYAEDFVEEGRLGKGGFGEVVKARKKLDGQIYAIKKITQRSQASLTEILKEVRLLSQLSHPAVVRYYNTWVEEVADLTGTDGETSTDDYTEETKETQSDGIDIQFHTSTGGLDFMSSNAIVEFGYDDETEDSDDGEETEDDDDSSSDNEAPSGRASSPEKERNMALIQKRAKFQRPYRTVLYISMEYCEKRVSSAQHAWWTEANGL
jgi:translation initiation factor 2-alpha kinase 4